MVQTVATEVELCNLALDLIQAKATIASLAEGSQEAAACARHYPLARNALLACFEWPFAEATAVLEQSLEYPVGLGWKWQYTYAMPDDLVAAREIWPGKRRPAVSERIPFALGRFPGSGPLQAATLLGCDLEPVANQQPALLYTCLVDDPTQFPPLFADALVASLAVRLAMPLAGKPELRAAAEKAYLQALARAQVASLQERQSDVEPEPDAIRARY